MSKYDIYHSRNTRDSLCYANDAEKGYPFDMGWVVGKMIDGSYDRVAVVIAEDLDDAYRDTNNINTRWVMNSNVRAEAKFLDGARSTSVGDVIHDRDNDKFYIVASFGFDEIDFAKLIGNKS